jgi:hypothetical protein
MEEQQDGSEVLETTETQVEETIEEETPAISKEELETLKAKAAKADELEEKNKQLFERAKKAEKAKAPSNEEGLSIKDTLYLAKADIHADDVEEVLELARLKKWDVKQAHDYLKPLLNDRAEERKTAAATQTRGGARGASKTTGEDLLRKAERTGELPDSDEAMRELAQARLNRKKANAK